MTVTESVQFLKERGSTLAEPVPVGDMPPMTFACSFSEVPIEASVLRGYFVSVPTDVAEFWSIAQSARLFEDEEYGQWGLAILDPIEAEAASKKLIADRPREVESGDLVLGHFLGDSDLLLVRCDATHHDFGSVIIAGPIDRRPDWYRPAPTFGAFLEQYTLSEGDKYWERRPAK